MKNNAKPRVDLRVIRTRQLIKDALIDLLQEMDINKITVNRIAERATINRVTFYLHYRDIEDMLEKMSDEMAEEIKGIMNSPISNEEFGENADWLKLENLLEYIAENAKFYKVVLGSTRTPIFKERLLKILTDTIKDRAESVSSLTPSNIQKDIAVWYGSAATIGTISAWLRADMPYTPQFLTKQLSVLLRSGKK